MRKIVATLAGTALFAAPVSATDWQAPSDVRAGTFVGARVKLSLGGKARASKPIAQFGIAPTRSFISGDGQVTTVIGDGLALNLSGKSRPTITLAGIRADRVLGLTGGRGPDGAKLGLSDGGKVAIGVVAALVVAGGVTYLVLANRCTECDQ